MGIFNGHLTPDLCVAAMKGNNTSLEYLAIKLEQMHKGECRVFSSSEIKAILLNHGSKGLRLLLDGAQPVEDEQMDLGRRLMEISSDDEEEDSFLLDALATPIGASVPSTPSMEDLQEEEEEEEVEVEVESEKTRFAWIPACSPLPPLQGHTWFYTVFLRVNGSKAMFAHMNINKNRVLLRKLERYRQAHLKSAQILDRLFERTKSVSDETIEAQGEDPHLWYEPLGESHYSSDRMYVETFVTNHVCKDTPLDVLRKNYPDVEWDPVVVAQHIREGRLVPVTSRIDGEWCPLGSEPPSIDTHTLYYGVVHVLNTCQRYLEEFWKDEQGGPVFDALWFYYASFVNLFEICLEQHSPPRMDDLYLLTPMGSEVMRSGIGIIPSERVTPWEVGSAYFNTGAFHAGDLPDLYHILMGIPLWGERQRPSYFMGKLYYKALPFACARRHIVKAVVECLDKSPGCWKVFSRIAWVMLAGLYPGDLGAYSTPFLGMRHLLFVKQLTDSKEALVNTLSRSSSSGGGPLIMSTIFSMHILYMASFNQQYLDQARRCIDWDNFKREATHLANIIRSSMVLSNTDPFEITRVQLNKTVKSPSTHVHRSRSKSMEALLMKQCNDYLEKKVLKVRQNHALDASILSRILESKGSDDDIKEFVTKTKLGAWVKREVTEDITIKHVQSAYNVTVRAQKFYSALFSRTHFKGPIVNLLIRMPYSERMSLKAFSVLQLEEYGGICETTVKTMCELVRIYHERAQPRDFRARIKQIKCKDFLVVCFYFNIVALLENIQFVPLSSNLIRETDEAMMARRHRLFPGQDVPDSMYDVAVSVCCNQICTLMGTGKHGNKKIAYDMEKEQFVCAWRTRAVSRVKVGDNIQEDDVVDSEDEEDDDDDDDSKEGEDEEDDDDDDDNMEDADYVANVLNAEEDDELDFNYGQLNSNNLIADASLLKGKGKRRTPAKENAKLLRNERKAWSKIPCGQPVLRFSLRGRALIWGTSLEKRLMYLHCPRCGALHMYTILNFAASEDGHYRCNECARKEQMHVVYRSCAYCKQSSTAQINQNTHLPVICLTKDPTNPNFDPTEHAEEVIQHLYFCKQHYRIAHRYCVGGRAVAKDELWALIKKKQAENTLRLARGDFRKK